MYCKGDPEKGKVKRPGNIAGGFIGRGIIVRMKVIPDVRSWV